MLPSHVCAVVLTPFQRSCNLVRMDAVHTML